MWGNHLVSSPSPSDTRGRRTVLLKFLPDFQHDPPLAAPVVQGRLAEQQPVPVDIDSLAVARLGVAPALLHQLVLEIAQLGLQVQDVEGSKLVESACEAHLGLREEPCQVVIPLQLGGRRWQPMRRGGCKAGRLGRRGGRNRRLGLAHGGRNWDRDHPQQYQ